jgi:hypothetical protein
MCNVTVNGNFATFEILPPCSLERSGDYKAGMCGEECLALNDDDYDGCRFGWATFDEYDEDGELVKGKAFPGYKCPRYAESKALKAAWRAQYIRKNCKTPEGTPVNPDDPIDLKLFDEK